MATHAQRGQVLMEAVFFAILLVGFFLIAFTLSETVMKAEGKNRFHSSRAGGIPSRGFR
jgi:hypothetical protein